MCLLPGRTPNLTDIVITEVISTNSTLEIAMLLQHRSLTSLVSHGVGCSRNSTVLYGRRGWPDFDPSKHRNSQQTSKTLAARAQQTTLPRQQQQKPMSKTQTNKSDGSVGSVDPRSKHFWTTRDMPPQDGKVVIVTGASSGMGWYCAQALAEHGAHVIIAARSLDRCQTAANLIKVCLPAYQDLDTKTWIPRLS